MKIENFVKKIKTILENQKEMVINEIQNMTEILNFYEQFSNISDFTNYENVNKKKIWTDLSKTI